MDHGTEVIIKRGKCRIIDPTRQQGEIEEDNVFHSISSNTVILLSISMRDARRAFDRV
jgi:hypothetical protein